MTEERIVRFVVEEKYAVEEEGERKAGKVAKHTRKGSVRMVRF